MAEAHIAALLPTQNRVVAADDNTAFLAHYDLNEHDVLRNIKAVGYDKVIELNSSYMNVPNIDIAIFRGAFTIEAWINLNSITGDQPLFSIGTAATNSQLHCVVRSGKPYLGFWSPDLQSTTTLSIGTWYHLAYIYTGTQQQIYINGVLSGAATTAAFAGTTSNGTVAFYANSKLNGKMKDFRIYARAKTAQEIQDGMYNKNLGEQGLRAYYKFNDNGAVIQDSSPFHNDSVITGTYNWVQDTNSVFTLRPKEGYFGGSALVVEEGVTNTATTFNSNYTNFATVDNNMAPPVDIGTQKVWHIVSGHYGGVQFSQPNAAINDVYTISWYAYIPNAGSVKWNVQNDSSVSSNRQMGSIVATAPAPGWYRYSITTTYTAAETGIRIRIENNLTTAWANSNNECWVTAIQVEKRSFASTFSKDTRPDSTLLYPNPIPNATEFTISFWMKKMGDSKSSQQCFLCIDQGTNADGIWIDEYSGQIRSFIYPTDGSGAFVNGTSTYDISQWTHISVVGNQSTLSLYINGAFANSVAVTKPFKIVGQLSIGKRLAVAAASNILVDELRIDNIARTDAEIAAWYYSNSPFWPRGIYRKPY